MLIEEKEFFREATLRICESLDVETFLYESFIYIRNFVPVDTVYLCHCYPNSNKQLVLATASLKGGTLLNVVSSVPPESQTYLERPDIRTLVFERADAHPMSKPWIERGVLKKNTSMLSLRLFLNGQYIGAAIFFAEGTGKLTQQHADLLAPLREPFSIALSNSLRYKELLELKELLTEDNRFLRRELLQNVGEQIIGADFGLKEVMEMVRQVAPISSPVLLQGETGTGKEVFAGAIHKLSPRKNGPFVKVNCGAIPESLLDSELFGHEKGAFTGALFRKRGRFERANGGTIFLDEVGELLPEAQVRLLRVLQEKEIERVGGTAPINVDIRVIAATHRDLKRMIHDGTFREDLFFRLNVFPITIPSLRDRKVDIPSLAHYFLQKKSHEMGRKEIPPLAPGTLEHLMAYSWPGNVRELANTIEHALILNKGEPLTLPELEHTPIPSMPFSPDTLIKNAADTQQPDTLVLDDVVSAHIRRVLAMTAGKVGGEGGAAEILHINPSTLRKRMRKLGIPFGRKAKDT